MLIQDVLYEGPNSLVGQSLHSRLGAEPTNGDGFGVGWYGAPDTPGIFHSTEPAWNDSNLRELAGHISSPLFFTHIRAAIGSAVQQTNCHPFRHDRWLFMHNGYINEFATIKRDLILAVELYGAAARNPALKAVTQAWMARSRQALELHFDPTTARELDAFIEGLVLHSALSTDPMTNQQIRDAIHRHLR
jgi:hypothetical protein